MKRIQIQAMIEVDVPDDAVIKDDFIVVGGKTLTPSIVLSHMDPDSDDGSGDLNWAEVYNDDHGIPLIAGNNESLDMKEVPCVPPPPLFG